MVANQVVFALVLNRYSSADRKVIRK